MGATWQKGKTLPKVTVTDVTGTSLSATVERDDVERAITPWFPGPPEELRKALFDLQARLDRNGFTGDLEVYLGIKIEPVE
jgi:hypothetical protein